MDAATPSKRARTTTSAASTAGTPHKTKKPALFGDQATATPEKPTHKVGAAADLTSTPDKTEQRPLLRRASGKGAVALSVKEVRRAALGLRRSDKAPVKEEEDALESVARELGVGTGAGRSPVKRRPEVRLPESYEKLCEFFNCFESSTRLLRMNRDGAGRYVLLDVGANGVEQAVWSLSASMGHMAAAELLALRGCALVPTDPLASSDHLRHGADHVVWLALIRLQVAREYGQEVLRAMEAAYGNLWAAQFMSAHLPQAVAAGPPAVMEDQVRDAVDRIWRANYRVFS